MENIAIPSTQEAKEAEELMATIRQRGEERVNGNTLAAHRSRQFESMVRHEWSTARIDRKISHRRARGFIATLPFVCLLDETDLELIGPSRLVCSATEHAAPLLRWSCTCHLSAGFVARKAVWRSWGRKRGGRKACKEVPSSAGYWWCKIRANPEITRKKKREMTVGCWPCTSTTPISGLPSPLHRLIYLMCHYIFNNSNYKKMFEYNFI